LSFSEVRMIHRLHHREAIRSQSSPLRPRPTGWPETPPATTGGGGKEAKAPRAFGHGGNQAAPIAAHPARERPSAHTLEGKEHVPGDDLPGSETGWGRLRHQGATLV
jgi:hypothetical protein